MENIEITDADYIDWLKLREQSKDEYGDKLCYCGHTYKCTCGDPSKSEFECAVKRGAIKLGDENNGWTLM